MSLELRTTYTAPFRFSDMFSQAVNVEKKLYYLAGRLHLEGSITGLLIHYPVDFSPLGPSREVSSDLGF